MCSVLFDGTARELRLLTLHRKCECSKFGATKHSGNLEFLTRSDESPELRKPQLSKTCAELPNGADFSIVTEGSSIVTRG
jgi:hypothetical protein